MTLLSIALLVAAPAFAQNTVAGDWDVTVNSPQGSNTTRVTFKQDGEKVSGVFKSVRGELPFEGGTLAGKDLKFTFTVETQGMQLPITLAGTMADDGATMTGKADFGGFAEGDWTAKRAEPGSPLPAAATSTSGAATTTAGAATTTTAGAATTTAPSTTTAAVGLVAGKWEITIKTPGGDRPATATLTEENGNLTGILASEVGEAPITGTIDGKSVKLAFTAVTPNGNLPITMTGDIDGDSILNGKAEIAGMGVMEFTAKRKQ
jgi:hypothetical protein